MIETGETERYLALARDCDSCNRLVESVEKIYAKGQRVVDDRFTMKNIRITRQAGRRFYVATAYAGQPTKIVNSDGDVVERIRAAKATLRFALLRTGESWVVTYYR